MEKILETQRLFIRAGKDSDLDLILNYYKSNEQFHKEFSPIRTDLFFSEKYWMTMLELSQRNFSEDKGYSFYIFNKEDDAILGHINFNNIVRGAFHACHIGYALSEESEGKGIMFEALDETIKHVFLKYNLHRVMANYILTNNRSGKLLSSLGFRNEGTAENYLYLDGEWKDHILTSLINPEWENELL
jgi:ribosomal-protein-alanine N-acetyltransferase